MTSTSEQGIIERETLERRIRFIARALPVLAVSDIVQEVTSYRCPLFMASTEELQAVYDRVRKLVHVFDFVVTGQAAFDRVRRASDDMLRVVAMLSDLENKPYENMAAHACRLELERREVAE